MEKRSTLSQMTSNDQIPFFWVVIPAAGVGSRMQSVIPKQYLPLGRLTVLEHTLNCFLDHPKLLGIVLCLSPDDTYWNSLAISKHPKIQTAIGGKERADSVLAGLNILTEQADDNAWVLVHDAARPNLQIDDLNKLLLIAGNDTVGGLLAVPARDTLKQIGEDGRVKATLDRRVIWQALTPQMFLLEPLRQALQLALQSGQAITDEASAMELAGYAPLLVEGRSDNLKVTHPEDIQWLVPYFINF